jgi:hypothetical protein
MHRNGSLPMAPAGSCSQESQVLSAIAFGINSALVLVEH